MAANTEDYVTCTFRSVRERDMDLLFLEAIAGDPTFIELFVNLTQYNGSAYTVLDVELSRTDAELGESDITVKLNIDGRLVGFLIEDKVDAPAMRNQHKRYISRGEKGQRDGEYEKFEVFIVCPEKYHRDNKEAQKYEHFLSYEKCLDYFRTHETPVNSIHVQQIIQALEHTKKSVETIQNEAAIAYNVQYHAYQERHYPSLRLRTSDCANGWWQHYMTGCGAVYIHHKTQEGYVDLTFPKAADKMKELEDVAKWLREHGMPDVMAVKVTHSGALRIHVPPLKVRSPFEDTEEEDLIKCFDAISRLNAFADLLADVSTVTGKQQ